MEENKKLHLSEVSLFYLFRGDLKLVTTKKPSKPASVAYFLNILDSKMDDVSGAYKAKGSSEWTRYNDSLKNIGDILVGYKKKKCPKGNYARFGEKELIEEFEHEYSINPQKRVEATKYFCNQLIGVCSDEKNKEIYNRIGQTILCLIDNDELIENDCEIPVLEGLRTITKAELHKMINNNSCTFDFYSLMLGAIYFINKRKYIEKSKNIKKNSSEDIYKYMYETTDYWEEEGKITVPDSYGKVSFVFNNPYENSINIYEIKKKFSSYASAVKNSSINKKIDICGTLQYFDKLYVCNDLMYYENADNQNVKKIITGEGSWQKLTELENNNNFNIIIGEGGLGKSMLLKSMFYQGNIAFLYGMKDKVNVLISLSGYNASGLEIFDYICNSIRTYDAGIGNNDIKIILESGNLRLFMDALDEVSYNSQEKVIDEINNFISEYPKCSFILTTREIARVNNLRNGKRYYIQEFTEDQVEQFILNWDLNENNFSLPENEIKNAFLEKIKKNFDKKMRSNPLILSMIFSAYIEDDMALSSKDDMYRMVFNIQYRRRLKKNINKGGFNSTLSKKEFRQFFSEFCGLCCYDDCLVLSRNKLEAYFKQIINDNNIDENVDDLIRDFNEEFGLIVREGDQYSFLHSSFRDYFAALYFTSEACEGKWKLSEILNIDADQRELCHFMYSVNKECCIKIVLTVLDELFSDCESKEDTWNAFKKYMKNTYKSYICYSEERACYLKQTGYYSDLYDANNYKTVLMNLVHIVLHDLKDDPSIYLEEDPYTMYNSFDSQLCSYLTEFIKKYDYNVELECLSIYAPEGIEPQYIEREIYESELYGTDFDEETGLPLYYGKKLYINEKIPTDGYSISVKSMLLGELDLKASGKQKEKQKDLKEILMNRSVFKPYHEFCNLRVLRDMLQKEDKEVEIKFGLRDKNVK